MIDRRTALLAGVASLATRVAEAKQSTGRSTKSDNDESETKSDANNTSKSSGAPDQGTTVSERASTSTDGALGANKKKKPNKPNKPGKPNKPKPNKPNSTNKPSIVCIVLDDMRASDWQALPYTRSLGGTWFENFFSNNPQCGPARTTLLTGMYSHNHGVSENGLGEDSAGVWNAFRRRGLDKRMIGQPLQKAGYKTALIGKFLNGYSGEIVPSGWNDWRVTTAPTYYGPRINENGKTVSYPGREYLTDILRKQAISFISDVPESDPLFLYWAPYAPHEPARPSRENEGQFAGTIVDRDPALNEEDMTDKPGYLQNYPPVDLQTLDYFEQQRLETLTSVDSAMRGIVKALKKSRRWNNTYLFVLSDNGYTMGAHRLVTKGVPYDSSVRIPMLAIGPRFSNGASDALVSTVDIPATIASIGKAKLNTAEGKDILSSPPSDVVLLESGIGDGWAALRGNDYVYAEYGSGEREYYDYKEDPFELDNQLSNTVTPMLPENEAAALSARLAGLKTCVRGACP